VLVDIMSMLWHVLCMLFYSCFIMLIIALNNVLTSTVMCYHATLTIIKMCSEFTSNFWSLIFVSACTFLYLF